MDKQVKDSNKKSVEKEHQFIDVPIKVSGEMGQKKHVSLEGAKVNSENGNFIMHLNEKHTLLIKKGFREKYLKFAFKSASKKIGTSTLSAPKFDVKESISSKARMKFFGRE